MTASLVLDIPPLRRHGLRADGHNKRSCHNHFFQLLEREIWETIWFFSEEVCGRSLKNKPPGYIGWKEHISPLQPVAEGWGEIRGSWQRHALRKCKNTFLTFWLSQGQTRRDNPKQRGIKSTRCRWSSDSGFLLLKLRHQEQSYLYYHYIKNGNPFGQVIHHESFSPLRNCGHHPCVRYPVTVWGQPDPPSSRW